MPFPNAGNEGAGEKIVLLARITAGARKRAPRHSCRVSELWTCTLTPQLSCKRVAREAKERAGEPLGRHLTCGPPGGSSGSTSRHRRGSGWTRALHDGHLR